VDNVGGNVCGVSGAEGLFVLLNPLFGGARDDVDDFFHCGVTVEFVCLTRGHCDADKHEFFGIGEVGTTDPFVRAPGQFFDLDIVFRNEAKEVFFGHGISFTKRFEVVCIVGFKIGWFG